MSAGPPLSLCLVCLSPPGAPVSVQQPLAGSGRPLGDVISELVTAPDRHMLRTVCGQCHQLLADFDAASERARGLRTTIQSVFDRADRHLVAMLLEPRQSRAVLAAAARHRQDGAAPAPTPAPTAGAALHIEILQTPDAGSEKGEQIPPLVSAPTQLPESAPLPSEAAPAVPQQDSPAAGRDANAPSAVSISERVVPAAAAATAAACRYRCSLCGQGFGDKALLLVHRRRQHGRRRGLSSLECSVCRQRLTSRAALQRHELSHAADGRLDCATCGRTFQRAATLQAHQRLHDERGLRCPYCPQKYTSRQDLEQHVARHTGARNCACPECGKTYRFRSNLAHHVQTVHRQAELACAVCGKTFNMLKKLRRHRNIVHGRLRYKCTECDSRFCYEGQLRRHMKKAKHASGGKDQSLEAYIETVETDADGTQMLTLVIEDGASGALGEDDTRETLVLSVGENFDSGLVDGPLEGSADGGRGDGTILEIIGDGDLTADSGDQIILEG